MKNKLILLFLSLISFAKISAMTFQERLDFSLQWAIATSDQDPAYVKGLIEAKADVNSRPYNSELGVEPNNLTLLGLATNKNQTEIVKTLLKHNASVDQLDDLGNTALMNAETSTIISLLLDAGANINHKGIGGLTPLYKAICFKKSEALNSLLQAITRLTKNEKDSIKNLLLVDQRLGTRLPKDLKMLIARIIHQLLAQDIHERIIRAGGESASWMALLSTGPEATDPECVKQVKQYFTLNSLEDLVRIQCLLPKRISQ